jgi:flagellar basal-body rod protein FlgG
LIGALSNGAAGINTQQVEIDAVAHNIANMNTAGYKRSRPHFTELMRQAIVDSGVPVSAGNQQGIRKGLGVAVAGINRSFQSGGLVETDRQLDLAIEGGGFLKVGLPQGVTCFTRDGSLKVDDSGFLATSAGYRILPEIQIPENCRSVKVGKDGAVFVIMAEGTEQKAGQILLYSFMNAGGLASVGENLYQPTPASGTLQEGVPSSGEFGVVHQGFLESSNVDLAGEMAELIEASRALGLNVRLVKTADEMWGMANNITRF